MGFSYGVAIFLSWSFNSGDVPNLFDFWCHALLNTIITRTSEWYCHTVKGKHIIQDFLRVAILLPLFPLLLIVFVPLQPLEHMGLFAEAE